MNPRDVIVNAHAARSTVEKERGRVESGGCTGIDGGDVLYLLALASVLDRVEDGAFGQELAANGDVLFHQAEANDLVAATERVEQHVEATGRVIAGRGRPEHKDVTLVDYEIAVGPGQRGSALHGQQQVSL
ncbi:MAG: hypothetical protein WBN36_01170 [Gammaproteobacteria bacterium]